LSCPRELVFNRLAGGTKAQAWPEQSGPLCVIGITRSNIVFVLPLRGLSLRPSKGHDNAAPNGAEEQDGAYLYNLVFVASRQLHADRAPARIGRSWFGVSLPSYENHEGRTHRGV